MRPSHYVLCPKLNHLEVSQLELHVELKIIFSSEEIRGLSEEDNDSLSILILRVNDFYTKFFFVFFSPLQKNQPSQNKNSTHVDIFFMLRLLDFKILKYILNNVVLSVMFYLNLVCTRFASSS